MALLLKEKDVRSLFAMDMALAAMEEVFRERGNGQAMVRLRTRMAAWQERNGLVRARLRESLDERAQALRARLGR